MMIIIILVWYFGQSHHTKRPETGQKIPVAGSMNKGPRHPSCWGLFVFFGGFFFNNRVANQYSGYGNQGG